MPYPDQELNAIDIVMQFAIHRLKFQPENILLFGWSIGGYPTSWAAMNYPDVKGVVCIYILFILFIECVVISSAILCSFAILDIHMFEMKISLLQYCMIIFSYLRL
jgi:pimeloyl-ACP methyl ester carboxylesterase